MRPRTSYSVRARAPAPLHRVDVSDEGRRRQRKRSSVVLGDRSILFADSVYGAAFRRAAATSTCGPTSATSSTFS